MKLPEPHLLDEVLGTAKWMVRQAKKEALAIGGKHIEIVGPTEDRAPEIAQSSSCSGESCGPAGALEW